MSPNSKGAPVQVSIQDVSRSDAVPPVKRIQAWVEHALGAEGPGELTIRVVAEPEGASLNQQFRQGRGATNVLAFPHGETALPETEEPSPLGDLVICAPVLQREAAAQRKSLQAHWAHIAIHGTLHLLGYDHESLEEARIMETRERELLAELGFDDPYADED